MKKPKKRIWGVKCPVCNKRMFSFHVHDYRTCGCENETMIDGGRDYLRYGWISGGVQPKKIYWSEKLDGEYPVVTKKDTFPY